MNEIIQGLWIGPELSVMEQMSLSSFIANGHEYHLYVYDHVKNIPAGTVVKDAAEILPADSIFQYQQRPSYAGFANFFRYKLLLERGGWWADADTVCLRPFDFREEFVFSTELSKGHEVLSSGVFKVPAGSDVMAYSWGVCQTKDPKRLVWGETGPRLLGEAVRKFELEKYSHPYYVFCPLGFWEWRRVLEADEFDEPDGKIALHGDTRAIHLWNEKWREAGQDKNADYPENCLYEQFKRKYGCGNNLLHDSKRGAGH
jgi:mannosyltransferase OCH1-like enzyme